MHRQVCKAKDCQAYADIKKAYKKSNPAKWEEIKKNFKKVCKDPKIGKSPSNTLLGMFTWNASANGHAYWSEIYSSI